MRLFVLTAGLAAFWAALLAPLGAVAAPQQSIPTWYASPEPTGSTPAVTLRDETVRQIVHVSAGGKMLRIRLSNAFGGNELHIAKVAIADREAGSSIKAGTSAPLTFGGKADVTVAPGGYALSDPIAFDVAPQSDLAVSLHVAGSVPLATVHLTQRKAAYFAAGDAVDAVTFPTITPPATGDQGLWLSEVEVAQSPARGVVVAFGDSITDGAGPKADTNAPWPDVLAGRLIKAKMPLAVINAAITGNRLLHAGSWAPFGTAGVARFDDDVLSQPNVKAVVVLIGINDIGQYGAGAQEPADAQQIETGLAQLAARAHENGVRIYIGTLTPFKATTIKDYYSDAKEAERQTVNAWIRSNSGFDGIADFEKALDDPANPGHMRPEYDSGDHLHPSIAGDAALANAIPLNWFK